VNIRLKLLSILPKLMLIGVNRFQDILSEFPEARTRSAILRLYDDRGNEIAFWLGFEDGRPAVRETDPRNPPYATTEVSMHVDTFIAVLKGRLDFRTAYIHDLIGIKSNDGLPAAYHLLLWSAFFDRVAELLK
jgi:hypothetical protein